MADLLFRELGNEGPYAGNFAVALGLMGDRRAIPMLRRLVMEPGGACDPVVKGAYPNRVKAILLLGRFADAEIAKTLKSIVLDNADGFMKDLYGQGAWKTPELCRFQALSSLSVHITEALFDPGSTTTSSGVVGMGTVRGIPVVM